MRGHSRPKRHSKPFSTDRWIPHLSMDPAKQGRHQCDVRGLAPIMAAEPPLNRRKCAIGKGLVQFPWTNTCSKTCTRVWRLHAGLSQRPGSPQEHGSPKWRSLSPSDTWCVCGFQLEHHAPSGDVVIKSSAQTQLCPKTVFSLRSNMGGWVGIWDEKLFHVAGRAAVSKKSLEQ